MREELLMMTRDYGPFIHTGGSHGANKGPWLQPHPDTYGLWISYDGLLELANGDEGEPERFPGPTALFVVPGPGQAVTATAGSSWSYLRFDVLYRPRERMPVAGRAWRPTKPADLPTPTAIWGHRPPAAVPPVLLEGAIQLVRDCCALWWRDDLAHAQANAALSHWLMDYLCATRPGRRAPRTGGMAERCRDLIGERLNLGIDVDELAAACGYSRRHFLRRFVAETGIQPGRFIREERLTHGAHLLATTAWPLNHIADRCGYTSVAAFSRAFTAWFHQRPGAWRRKHR
jgi:AraC-like DNA-binding protein